LRSKSFENNASPQRHFIQSPSGISRFESGRTVKYLDFLKSSKTAPHLSRQLTTKLAPDAMLLGLNNTVPTINFGPATNLNRRRVLGKLGHHYLTPVQLFGVVKLGIPPPGKAHNGHAIFQSFDNHIFSRPTS
jgi:hypothetical protein